MNSIRFFMRYLRSRWAALVHDLMMVPVAWMLAYWLRYNLDMIPPEFLSKALLLIPLVVFIQGLVFVMFGLYRGVWRFASVPDLFRIVKAVVFGTLMIALAIFFVTRLAQVPRSVFVVYPILLIGLLGSPRFLYRLIKDRRFRVDNTRRVAVIGAGKAGETLVRDLLRNTPRVFDPIAFVDDDESKVGKEIHGIRVVGGTVAISQIVQQLKIELLILAMPSASAEQMRTVVERCEESGVPFRTLPKLHDLVSGQPIAAELREVRIDDLLGREPVSMDWSAIKEGLAGRTILVTGGGGSIGSELCHQLARLGPAQLILFERSEYNLYRIENILRQKYPELPLQLILGDICDEVSVNNVFSRFQPDVVFHAAAYKHVPMLESQTREAVNNNVFGTRLVALAANRARCKAFVLISTDKAVNPSNVMGTSKRIAELFCQSLSEHSEVRFITVRFGNVLGSAGSVVPLFRSQISRGGPVTVTHPDVTRYFMTTAEACQLILQASVMGKGGEIYVLDMGEPIKISYLAEQMIRLSGKVPGDDIRIVYTGMRPGEKLFEELFHPDENLRPTVHEKILLARSREVDNVYLDARLNVLDKACHNFDEAVIRKIMKELVPEQQESDKSLRTVSLKVVDTGST